MVTIEKTENLLGSSTPESIRSGIYNGYVAMVDGLIGKIRSEFGIEKTILTGGNSNEVSEGIVESDLMLEGLRLLAAR